MAEIKAQTLKNHGRFDPWYHFFILPILLANFLVCIVHDLHEPRHFNEWLILLAVVWLVFATKLRTYSLKVQDRVIRLEERLRLTSILPENLRSRIPDLAEGQLIALRFASDGEVPALVEKTLREKLEPKQIKQAIQVWRPDYWRV